MFKTVCVCVPDLDGAILGTGNNDGQLGVVACERDIAGVTLEGCDQSLGCVIPNLDSAVVRGSEQVRLVGLRVVINVVDALSVVCIESIVGGARAQTPNLDGAVQTCRGEGVGVLGVDGQTHNVVAVALEDLDALPSTLPIPKLDCHVI